MNSRIVRVSDSIVPIINNISIGDFVVVYGNLYDGKSPEVLLRRMSIDSRSVFVNETVFIEVLS